MSENWESLRVEHLDSVALLTLDRPEVLNALSRQALLEIKLALTELEEDPAVGAVIITGAGDRAFAAGADIQEFQGLDVTAARQVSVLGQTVFDRVEYFPKPVIAAVNGFCLGGGCELALSCHIRIGSHKAKFGQPEVKLGLIPGYGGSQRLPRLIGAGAALEILLTGDMISADRALALGLISQIVEERELLRHCRQLAARILENGPLAIRYCLESVRSGLQSPIREGLALESNLFGLCFASGDAQRGIEAFLQKKKPEFKGS